MAAVPVAGMLALGIALGKPVGAVTAGAGAMIVGVAWRGAGGPARPPVGTMAAAAAALAVATLTGTLSGGLPWLHLALLAVFCLLAGLASSLGRRGSVVGTQSVIAFVVFGRFPESGVGALELAGLVLAGGAVQMAFASLVARPGTRRRQREAVAGAYRQLAALAAAPAGPSAAAASALDAAEARLGVPALFADPALVTLSQLVDEGRRIRLELIALGTVAEPARADSRLAALVGQVLAAARLAERAGRDGRGIISARPSRGAWRPRDAVASDLRRMRAAAALSSPAGRHAIRLAVVVSGTELLTQQVALPRGYWAVVAAATGPYRELQGGLPGPAPEGVAAALDELIDATDTVAASLGLRLP